MEQDIYGYLNYSVVRYLIYFRCLLFLTKYY